MAACRALQECWQRVDADPVVQVAIVTAAGDRAFCAGFDIAEKQVDGRPSIEDVSPRLGTHCRLAKPLIAAVNGLAVAAGVYLVEACDLCVAAQSAWFALPEVKLGIGVQPFVQSLWTLPQKVLMELLLTGEPLTAQRAYELGFVNRLVPDDQLLSSALELGESIAANAPLVIRASKAMLYAGQEAMGMERALEEAERLFEPVSHSTDAREGFRARNEKRRPVWRER
jgi:enoyl-CoA hydratase/carnithine racemase